MPNGFLFGLASGGVYLAMNCYQPCVRSYRTLSPLPPIPIARKHNEGGLLSAALAVGLHRPGVTWHLAL